MYARQTWECLLGFCLSCFCCICCAIIGIMMLRRIKQSLQSLTVSVKFLFFTRSTHRYYNPAKRFLTTPKARARDRLALAICQLNSSKAYQGEATVGGR